MTMRHIAIAIRGPLADLKPLSTEGQRMLTWALQSARIIQRLHPGVRLTLEDATIVAERLRDNGVAMHYEGKIR